MAASGVRSLVSRRSASSAWRSGAAAPLVMADGAVLLDTSDLDVAAAIAVAIAAVERATPGAIVDASR